MNLYFVICIIFVIADLIFLFFGSYHTWSLWFDGLAFWYFFTAFIWLYSDLLWASVLF